MSRRRCRIAALLMLSFAATACGDPTGIVPEFVTLEVAPTTMRCQGLYEQDCLQVRFPGATVWSLFYDPIQGFTFEPGYQYRLRVIVRMVDVRHTADRSSLEYHLVRVLSKVAAPPT